MTTSATINVARDLADFDVTIQGTVTEQGVEDFTVQVITDEDGEMCSFPLTDAEREEAERALIEADADEYMQRYHDHCNHVADCARDGDS